MCAPGTTCNSQGDCDGPTATGPECGQTRCMAGRIRASTGRCMNTELFQDCRTTAQFAPSMPPANIQRAVLTLPHSVRRGSFAPIKASRSPSCPVQWALMSALSKALAWGARCRLLRGGHAAARIHRDAWRGDSDAVWRACAGACAAHRCSREPRPNPIWQDPGFVAGFRQALRELGWEDGRNVRIDMRWGAGNRENYRKYAAEFAALAPDVIFAATTDAVVSVQQASPNVPVVFVGAIDPVGSGLITSMARPGGNATGFTDFRIRDCREMARAAQGDRARSDTSRRAARCQRGVRDRPVCRDPGRDPRSASS